MKYSGNMSVNGTDADRPELNNFEWLGKYYTTANDIRSVLDDDFATIKKRLIDKNRKELENGADAIWYTKTVVRNFIQSVSKSMENLAELKLGVIKELRFRYPLLKEEWLSVESQAHVVPSFLSQTATLNGAAEAYSPDSNDTEIEKEEGSQDDIKFEEDERASISIIAEADESIVSGNCGNDETEIVEEETPPDDGVKKPEELELIEQVTTSGINGVSSTVQLEEKSQKIRRAIRNARKVTDKSGESALVNSVQNDKAHKELVSKQIEKCDNTDQSTDIRAPENEKKTTIVVDDQIPGPSRLFHLSKRGLTRAKKRYFEKEPLLDSSDSDYEEPLAKTPKKSTPIIAPVSKSKILAKSKQPFCSKRGPFSRRTKTKASKTTENPSASEKSDPENGITTNSYWDSHDYKDDEKLKMKAHVVITKKDKDACKD